LKVQKIINPTLVDPHDVLGLTKEESLADAMVSARIQQCVYEGPYSEEIHNNKNDVRFPIDS